MAGSDDFEARLAEVGFIVEQERKVPPQASSLELAQLSWNGFECLKRAATGELERERPHLCLAATCEPSEPGNG